MSVDYIKEPKAHPRYGDIIYDENGMVVCHICGKSYNKLGAHTWNGHRLRAREYRKMFGLDVTKGICTQELKAVLQENVERNYGKVVQENLIAKGAKTRYKEGSEGRTIEKVSEQTARRLSELGKRTGPKNSGKGKKRVKSGRDE